MQAQQLLVKKLADLLSEHSNVKKALITAIQDANEKEIKNLDQFYNLVTGLLTHIPTDEQLNANTETFWYILNKSADDTLKKSEAFQNWVREFILSMGKYMDSTDSAKAIDTFIKDQKNK